MYHEILVPCAHAQKVITCSKKIYIPVNSSICIRHFGKCTHRVRANRVTESCHLLKKQSESALEVRRCTTKFSYLAHVRRRRSPVQMQVYIPVNISICIRTLREVYSVVWELIELQSHVTCLKSALKVLWKCADVPRNSRTLHTCGRRRSPVQMQVYIPVNSSICIRTLREVYSSCEELIELAESCHLLKKRSESALEVRRCTTKFSYLAHMRRKEITCSNASLHPSEQFYMHKNTSGSVVIVWELIELTESCHCLKSALKVLWKCADVPRNSRTLHTCAEGDRLFKCKFTSRWAVLYA